MESDYYIEGYATTFEPYVLYEDANGPVYEQIEPTAFRDAKMDDVIMQLNHEGTVCARMSNQTLGLAVDEHGLFIWADLGRTSFARERFEEVQSGMITKMSWGFLVAPEGRSYDAATRTIHINKVKEVVDVSLVSLPANDQTEVYSRSRELVASHDNTRKRLALLIDTMKGEM